MNYFYEFSKEKLKTIFEEIQFGIEDVMSQFGRNSLLEDKILISIPSYFYEGLIS